MCFPRFEPKLSHDWYFRDRSSGCVGEKQGVSMCNNGEGFVNLARVDMSLSLKVCKQKCLRTCSCMAYASANESEGGIGCLTWQEDLVDIRTYSDVGQDLNIHVDVVVLGTFSSFTLKILIKFFTKIHSEFPHPIWWLGHRFSVLGR